MNGHIYALKKVHFFWGTPSKISFFTNYTTWQISNFYSTDRIDPDAPFEMKIEKSKKKIFVWEGGEARLILKLKTYYFRKNRVCFMT
jgi:hypothetical protein